MCPFAGMLPRRIDSAEATREAFVITAVITPNNSEAIARALGRERFRP
jgi:hypothetical protein